MEGALTPNPFPVFNPGFRHYNRGFHSKQVILVLNVAVNALIIHFLFRNF
jgi:hypothetical protein